MQDATLYRSEVPATSFTPVGGEDWQWVSHEAVTPIAVDEIPDLLSALETQAVELRFMPSLAPLRGAWNSTPHASGPRLANPATPPA